MLAEQEAARRLPTLSGDPGPPSSTDGTSPSQPELSFVVEGAAHGQGFSAMPPAANTPDLFQVAQAKGKDSLVDLVKQIRAREMLILDALRKRAEAQNAH